MNNEDYSAMKLKIRLESELLHVRGKLKACEQQDDGSYKLVATCPARDSKNSINAKLAENLSISSNSLRLACDGCLGRFFIPYVEIVDYKRTLSRLFKKFIFNSSLFIMFLLSLKFEPRFHYERKVRFLLAPIYLLVNIFKLNTLLMKAEIFYRKVQAKRIGQKQEAPLKPGFYQPSPGM